MDWPALAIGTAIPPVRLRITDALVTGFAEVANDFSHMHFDDEFARGRGFPSAIAHGAIAASTFFDLLESWLGDWPLEAEDLQVTFIAPSFRGDEVVTGGEVTSLDGDRAVLNLWCAAGDRKLAVAQATVLRSVRTRQPSSTQETTR